MNERRVRELAAEFEKIERIPVDKAGQLIALLRSAPDEALRLIVAHKVKFCWMIARRILEDRKERKV